MDKPLKTFSLAKRMGQRAEEHCKNGYCCAEAMCLATIETFSRKDATTSTDFVNMATGLCGGMGNKKATCGVFTGGAMALGLLSGRFFASKKDNKIRQYSAYFHEQLSAEIGGDICQDLLEKFRILSNRNRKMCHLLTRRGAEILAQIIVDNQLIDDNNKSDKSAT